MYRNSTPVTSRCSAKCAKNHFQTGSFSDFLNTVQFWMVWLWKIREKKYLKIRDISARLNYMTICNSSFMRCLTIFLVISDIFNFETRQVCSEEMETVIRRLSHGDFIIFHRATVQYIFMFMLNTKYVQSCHKDCETYQDGEWGDEPRNPA